jgi:hypothetical protein
MTTHARRAGLSVILSSILALLVLLAVHCAPVFAAAASPSPSAAAVKKPFVNWSWLAVGLGGALILLGIMYYLSRHIRPRGEGD